jgi:hypothetical protein
LTLLRVKTAAAVAGRSLAITARSSRPLDLIPQASAPLLKPRHERRIAVTLTQRDEARRNAAAIAIARGY